MAIKQDGPVPKLPSKRRRTNKPASYGLAEPILAGQAARQPDLSFDPHPAVARLWEALGRSVEARFFSAADWERANLELLFLNSALTMSDLGISPSCWQRVQTGLSELLVSPADKRRVGIELKAAASDPDEDAAVLQMVKYQEQLS